jgi:hypothetical protein
MEMAAAMEAEFEEAEGEARQEFESQREEIKVNTPPLLFENVLLFFSLYFMECSVPVYSFRVAGTNFGGLCGVLTRLRWQLASLSNST